MSLGQKDRKIGQNATFHVNTTSRSISDILYLLQALRDSYKSKFSVSYTEQISSHLFHLLQQLHTMRLRNTCPRQGCIKGELSVHWPDSWGMLFHVASDIWLWKDALDAHDFDNKKHLRIMTARFVADLMFICQVSPISWSALAPYSQSGVGHTLKSVKAAKCFECSQ